MIMIIIIIIVIIIIIIIIISFKKSIFEDKALIPALRHSHICHGIDAQIREGDRHWNRAGKKFSGEPKIGNININSST